MALCMSAAPFRGKMSKFFLLLVLFCVAACQSTQEKNQTLVRDSFEKLKPLSTWKPTWCRVDTKLTQPALARYREMFVAETEKLQTEAWSYTWKARETSCEVTSLEDAPLSRNHRGILETVFCTLLQTHYVNSPFDELKIMPEDISSHEDKVQIKMGVGGAEDLGLYLDPKAVSVETRTKSRGALNAVYAESEHQWLPERIEQKTATTVLLIDGFEYSAAPVGGRRLLKSFWISLGDSRALPHTQVFLSSCRPF